MIPHRHRFPLLSKPEAPELGKASSRPWESVCVQCEVPSPSVFWEYFPRVKLNLIFFPNIRWEVERDMGVAEVIAWSVWGLTFRDLDLFLARKILLYIGDVAALAFLERPSESSWECGAASTFSSASCARTDCLCAQLGLSSVHL